MTSRPGQAALWMIGAIGGFSAMAVAARALSGPLDTFEIMAWRSAVGLALMLTVIGARRDWGAMRPQALGQHLIRNATHFAGQNLWLFALTLIPMAQLFALEFSYPIMVALAAPLWLGERMDRTRALAAALGFAGVLIVAHPWSSGGWSLGILAALAAAATFAVATMMTKALTRRVSVTAILFWVCAIQLALGLVTAGYDGRFAVPLGMGWVWVAVIGSTGLVGHFALTRALELAPASVVAPMDFLRLPLIGIVAWLAYGEALDPAVFLGGAVILAGNWVNLRGESAKSAT